MPSAFSVCNPAQDGSGLIDRQELVEMLRVRRRCQQPVKGKHFRVSDIVGEAPGSHKAEKAEACRVLCKSIDRWLLARSSKSCRRMLFALRPCLVCLVAVWLRPGNLKDCSFNVSDFQLLHTDVPSRNQPRRLKQPSKRWNDLKSLR